MAENCLVGKTCVAVDLADDGGAIRFVLDDGSEVVARADGDCCSHTWIENVDAPERLVGAPILSVRDIAMPDLGQPGEYDVIAYYGCEITTALGAVVIDYRNSSNGYYGGSLQWPSEHFYGGVDGQNVSSMRWKRIAPAEGATTR